MTTSQLQILSIRSRTGWYLVLFFTICQTGAAQCSSHRAVDMQMAKQAQCHLVIASTHHDNKSAANTLDQKQNWLVSSAVLQDLSDWSGTMFITSSSWHASGQASTMPSSHCVNSSWQQVSCKYSRSEAELAGIWCFSSQFVRLERHNVHHIEQLTCQWPSKHHAI